MSVVVLRRAPRRRSQPPAARRARPGDRGRRAEV